MRIRQFQALVLAGFILHLVYWALPLTDIGITPGTAAALDYHGLGAKQILLHPALPVAFLALRLMASAGLFFMFAWGRTLFAAWLLITLPLTLFSGIAVFPPLDGFIGYISALVDGAIIVVAFTQPISRLLGNDSPGRTDQQTPRDGR